jgi:sarcosine oxidase, subunit beta
MASSDILVVGGGVIGTCLALHLARRRAGRVMLLERAFPGAGSSGKSAAIVRSRDTTPLTSAMAQAGLHVYEHFSETVGGPAVFTRTGLALIAPAADRENLVAASATASGEGEGLRLISAHDLADIDPNVQLSDDEAAAIEPAAGYLDPVQVVTSFAEAARRHGADVRLGVEVKRVNGEKGRVTGVETNEGVVACGTLVLATGPWTAGLLRSPKIALPLEGQRRSAALYRRPPDAGRRTLALADFVQKLLFRSTPGDLVQVGSFQPADDRNPADPDDADEPAAGEWLATVRQRMSRRYPALHRAFGRGGFSFVYAMTPDGQPIVDQLPGLDGAWCAAGFGDNAFQLAPAVGEALAARIVDGPDAAFDAGALRLGRFEENSPIQPDWPYGTAG